MSASDIMKKYERIDAQNAQTIRNQPRIQSPKNYNQEVNDILGINPPIKSNNFLSSLSQRTTPNGANVWKNIPQPSNFSADDVMKSINLQNTASPEQRTYENNLKAFKESRDGRARQNLTDFNAGLGKFTNTMTRGLKDMALSKLLPDLYKEQQLAYRDSSTVDLPEFNVPLIGKVGGKDTHLLNGIGELGGYLVPGSAIGKGLKAMLPFLGKTTAKAGAGIASKIGTSLLNVGKGAATGGLEGVAMGAPVGFNQGIENNMSFGDAVRNAGKTSLEFGAAGALLGGGFAGAGEGVGMLKKGYNALQRAPGEVANMFGDTIRPSIESANSSVGRAMPGATADYLTSMGLGVKNPQISPNYNDIFSNRNNPMPSAQPMESTLESILRPSSVQSNIKLHPTNFKPMEGLKNMPKTNEPMAPTQQVQPIEPTSQMTPRAKHSPEVQATVDEINSRYDEYVANRKWDIQNGHIDRQTGAKDLKALGFQRSAELRKVIQGDSLVPVEGGLTSNELSKEIARRKTNHAGKEVKTPDGEGIVTGKMSFGKVEVKFQDGSKAYYPAKDVEAKVNIDDLIAQQKQALNATKVESNIQTPSPTIEPVKTPNMENEIIPQQRPSTPQPVKSPEPQMDEFYHSGESGNMYSQPTATKASSPMAPDYIENIKPSGPVKRSKLDTNSIRTAEFMQNPMAQRALDEANMTYNQKSNAESTRIANQKLAEDYKGMVDALNENGVGSSEDVIALKKIMEDMKAVKDSHGLTKMARSIQPGATNIGQIIQAFSTFKPKTLEGQVLKAQKIVSATEKLLKETNPEKYAKTMKSVRLDVNAIDTFINNPQNLAMIKINPQLFAEKLQAVANLPKNYIERIVKMSQTGKYSTDELVAIIKEKYGIPSLTTDNVSEIAKLFDEAQNYSPKSYEHRMYIDKMMSVIPDKLPKTLADKVRAWQSMDLFGNTKTISKIAGGNVGQVGLHDAKEIVRTGVDKLIGLFTKQKTATLPDVRTQFKGFKNRFKEVIKDWRNDVNTDPFTNQYEYTHQGRTFDNQTLHNVNRTVKSAMSLFESPFKQAVYDDVLRQEMKLAGVKEATPEMEALALKEAEKVMFHDDNVATNFLSQMRGGLNKLGNTGLEKLSGGKFKSADPSKFGVGNLLLPVLKTPTNMMLRALEYSPLNAVRGIAELATKGKAGQKAASDAIAKAIVGTGIGAVGYGLAKNGLAYGGPDTDKDVNDFNKEIGKQPYSVNLPFGTNMTYDWMQPGSTAFSFGAELGQANKNKKPLSAALNSLLQQSVLQNVNQALGGGRATSNPASNFGDALLNSTNQAVPSLLYQFTKAIDPYQRETSSVPFGGVVNKTPFRMLLPEKLTKTGQKMDETNAFNIWFNPSNVRSISNDPAMNELSSLYERSGEKKQFPTSAPTKATVKKKQIDFTPQQQRQMQIDLGQKTLEQFNKTISTSKYRNASDEEKAKILAANIEKIKASLVKKNTKK